jgi:hypothetical protein
MRRLVIRVTLSGVVLAALLAQGCGGSETYGEAVTETTRTAVADILQEPETYAGKMVRVEGTIANECPSGCWFELREGGAIIYVDLAPRGLAIPQHVGKKVVVAGTVIVDGMRVQIHAKGVEIH